MSDEERDRAIKQDITNRFMRRRIVIRKRLAAVMEARLKEASK